MLIVFFRALILYLVVFIVIRLMGKRELSKVQPFELVIIIIIADLVSGPMSSPGISIFDGIVPMVTLLISYIIVTFLIRSSNKVQEVICGKVCVIIENGKILEEELEKHQYTIADLMTQLRQKDIFMVQDVKYAIIETNGDINVIKMDENMDKFPLNIIEDGKISDNNLEILGYDIDKVERLLKKEKIKLEDVLIGTIDTNSKFLYQLKEVKK
ncbi:MAG: DUF421 domain-containing protein [Clostridia bacterium]|nr:DUF421 domain-containing protein [Clostridia bacterium]